MSEDINEDNKLRVEDIEHFEVQCADCEEHLYNLVKLRNGDKRVWLIVKCPFCDGESWTIDIHGEYLQAPPEDLIVEEVWQEEETFYISLKGVDDD